MAPRGSQLCGLDLEPHIVPGFNSVTLVGFVGADTETRQRKRTVRSSPFSPSPRGARGRNAEEEWVSKNRVASRLLILVSGFRGVAKESRLHRSPCSGR
jgi:hypothetical protein